ncbi:MAG TPA: RagB/SusD family nutrient uptake outer membrane protein [Gemmatimonadales bacterium]
MPTMPNTISTSRSPRRMLVAGLGAALLLSACSEFDLRNTNAPTVEELTGTPSRAVLARTATGIFSQALNDVGGIIQQWGIYGREGYNLLGNDPRETGEEIRGPQEAGGRAGQAWTGGYGAIRTINAYLAALPVGVGVTEQEVRASAGFAKTIKAWHMHRIAVRTGALGMPIDVDKPITEPPAPFVSFAAAEEAVSALLDEGLADLQAGSAAFPFTVAPGYVGFTTPATFTQFNRALAAKVLVHRATFLACAACWAQASTAMNASFVTAAGLPGSLATGVYYAYSTAAGEPLNPVSENIGSNRYWVHPSIVTGAQLRANGEPDLRLTSKVTQAPTARSLNELTGTHKPTLYNLAGTPTSADQGTDIAWIKNEELLLLRAEIRWNTADKAGAVDDINLVRQHAGGLAASTLTAGSSDDAFITELLYNRVYSLMWEQGTRWIDARRYNRLSDLPVDRPGDSRYNSMLVPAGECDARGLSVPCSPLGN